MKIPYIEVTDLELCDKAVPLVERVHNPKQLTMAVTVDIFSFSIWVNQIYNMWYYIGMELYGSDTIVMISYD